MDSNTAWNKFAASGKIADYLEYRESCADAYKIIEGIFNDADKDRRNSYKATENQR